MNEGRFSGEELDQFNQLGFVVTRGMIDAERLAPLQRVALDHLERRVAPFELEAEVQYPGAPATSSASGGDTIRRLLQAYQRDPVFTRWAGNPNLLGRLGQLLDSEALLLTQNHHNCVMTKQPAFSSATGWHRDTRYWHYGDDLLVNTWLALGPETRENGCLRLIPGSHRMPIANEQIDAAQFLRPELAQNKRAIESAVEVSLAAGDVLFFHANAFHAASRNQTEQPKLAVVFSYRTPANTALPDTRSSLLPDLPLVAPR